ncbi:GHMP family kinase ATP-binding protein, partial [Sandarakinorhabdus rubra]
MLLESAPAKINLALHLRRRRADGYHDLESVFAFTEFGDTLRASPAEGLSLSLIGPTSAAADVGDDNLVLKAARALATAAGVTAGASLVLEKRIPVAAGLGGGSADAAAALRLLNRLWGLDWPLAQL